eukprot:TRINITY_DN5399_c0_g1_i1.p1 TRINITY_DN5399_c0_g1~~TRINITY_DN5399_c0_g1_i1.p1  ORF type:complete len:458 (+),score=96.92 TRINITY_DN5399_c0_g1_i1:224-1597(+)
MPSRLSALPDNTSFCFDRITSMNHYDMQDTNSSSSAPTGAGLALPVPPHWTDKEVKLETGVPALHQHLVREFNSAEEAAHDATAVSSIMSVDLGQVERQFQKFTQLMPRVRPFYAVKANPDKAIVQTLFEAGAGFDCASAPEIEMVRAAGADGTTDVIFANCCKFPRDIAYAKSQGVSRMTVDNLDELEKIALHFPEAQVVIRIVTDDSNSICRLSNKYGAALCDVEELLTTAIRLGLDVVGVSFHVGSGTSTADSFGEPIKNAARVFETAKHFGIEMKLLDLGGGFPGDDEGIVTFSQIADEINPLLDEYFPIEKGIEIISEPGRFFSHASATLATKVIARRVVSAAAKGENDPDVLYYLGDGVYGSFNCVLFDHYTPPLPTVIPVKAGVQSECVLLQSRVFGPTCDGLDTIYEQAALPMLNVGDILVFRHMGAYTVAAASNFNGISKPKIVYVRT